MKFKAFICESAKLDLTSFSETVDEDVLADVIRSHNLRLMFDGQGVHDLKNAFDEVICRDEAERLEISVDSTMIDSIAYQKVLYSTSEKALYLSANIEFAFSQSVKAQESRDMIARKAVGEDFVLIDTLKKAKGDVIDVTKFFRGGIPGA